MTTTIATGGEPQDPPPRSGGGGPPKAVEGEVSDHVRAADVTFKRARMLRRELTLPEVILWQPLRGRRLDGLRFRRQHPIGPYILDFFCPEARLGVEVDGASHLHADGAAHDVRRDAWLLQRGIAVLRVAAAEVLDEAKRADILHAIATAAAPSTACGGPPPPLGGGECAPST